MKHRMQLSSIARLSEEEQWLKPCTSDPKAPNRGSDSRKDVSGVRQISKTEASFGKPIPSEPVLRRSDERCG